MKKVLIVGVAAWFAASISAFGASGADIWKANCAKCHGADGAGKTAMGKKLKMKDYSAEAVSEEAVAKAIKDGVKEGGKVVMKPIAGLSDDDVKAVAAHMKSLKK
ncbi:MAG TPA: cytochrome c [Verrucomicrobiae bacterium]|nr:cytochrome c [Verrucomicrobiae bacterium]